MKGSVNFITAEMADAVSKTSGGTFNGNVIIDRQSGVTSEDWSKLVLGNNIPVGTVKNETGVLELYDAGSHWTRIRPNSLTNDRNLRLPDADGTIAVTADIPTDFVSKANGGTFQDSIKVVGTITADKMDGTESTEGYTNLVAGNGTPSGTVGNSKGQLQLFGSTGKYVVLDPDAPSSNRRIKFPNQAGTLFLKEGGTFSGNIVVNRADGTAETVGTSILTIGNSTSSGIAGNSTGRLALYGKDVRAVTLCADLIGSSHKTIQLPNANGTLALDHETVYTITSFKNGWTGNIRVTHNKSTKITSLSGLLNGTNATSDVFADATTDVDNTTKIPVSSQAVAIVPNLVTGNPITFGQVSGNDWQAALSKSVGQVAICIVYVSAY